MAAREDQNFDKALAQAGIALDARDRAAALPVFRSLAAACALLKAAGITDDPSR